MGHPGFKRLVSAFLHKILNSKYQLMKVFLGVGEKHVQIFLWKGVVESVYYVSALLLTITALTLSLSLVSSIYGG